MIDEDTALRNSLQKTFTGMSILICLWHIQQNMKKHSAFLNSNEEEKKIQLLIISLPFVKNKIKFEELNQQIQLLKNMSILGQSFVISLASL